MPLHPRFYPMNGISSRIQLGDVQALRPASVGARTDGETRARPLSPLEALLKPEVRGEKDFLPDQIPAGNFYGMVGRTPAMLSVFAALARIASYPVTALLLGESGTGKSAAARAIHQASDRADMRMISFDCRRPQETPMENILFGEVGETDSSVRSLERPGLLELAQGGTIYLQEISALAMDMQVKLLRVLESGELRRVGCAKLRKLDVRIITSSAMDLSELCTQGKFRGDFLYRLSVGAVRLPALHEAPEEIPCLIDHLLERISMEAEIPGLALSIEARAKLSEPRWAENVRGLVEILRTGSSRATGCTIERSDLPIADPS